MQNKPTTNKVMQDKGTQDKSIENISSRKNHAWVNPACEYGPLFVFLGTYLGTDLFTATAAVMGATLISLFFSYALTRAWPKIPLATAPILLILGGLTLYLQDETFIKIRPTLVNGLFCIGLALSVWFNKQPLKFIMGHSLSLDTAGWRKLTLRFAGFFAFLALMNEIVWRTQSNDFWVTYKVFGAMGFMVLFMLCQIPMISHHMQKDPQQN